MVAFECRTVSYENTNSNVALMQPASTSNTGTCLIMLSYQVLIVVKLLSQLIN